MDTDWKILVLVFAIMFASSHAVNKTEPKILIIGAGMSGMSAAKTLNDAGYDNFLIIEGSSRFGGRLKSSSLSGYTVELGAMWIYGKGSNPMHNLLKQHGISRVDIPGTISVRDSDGNDLTPLADISLSNIEGAIERFDVEAKEAHEQGLSDFSIDSRLRYYNWSKYTDVNYVIEKYYIDFEFTVPSAYLSGKHAYIWAPYEEFDSDDTELLDDSNGYQSLIKNLGEEFLGDEMDNDHIVYNKKVTEISQTNVGVEVKTSDGTTYTGDYVIVTSSLGVLQNKEISFSPNLPVCKQKAIDQFGMGYLTQIYIKFPFQFWDDTSFVLYQSSQPGKYTIWLNMNHVLPGSNILQLSLTGEEAMHAEQQNDQTVIDDIMTHVRLMYPNQNVPDPEDYIIPKWAHDPLYYGAYSYWPTGFTNENMMDMKAPYGRVFFAGEHLDPIQYSYAHGAYASGIKTANDLQQCLQNQDACGNRSDTFHCMSNKMETDCPVASGSKSFIFSWFCIILLCTLSLLFNL